MAERGGAAWRVGAASVRGVGHQKSGLPCQDAHAFEVLDDGALLVAVADGAGSAPHAQMGAQIAATTALKALELALATDPPRGEDGWFAALTNALETARGAVEAAAGEKRVPACDLSATLILVVAIPGQVMAAQVGDGAVVLADRNGSLHALTSPQSGEYINETTFVTTPGAVEGALRMSWRGDARFVAVFSDGLQRLALKMPEWIPHGPFFAPLFQFIGKAGDQASEQIASFLTSPRVVERCDDDLTLVLAARAP